MSAQDDLAQWSKWKREIHESPVQKKRQFRAYGIRSEAVWEGKEWRVRGYTVTLTSCECADFEERHLPCKHIYAVALRSNISVPAVTGEQWKTARDQNLKNAVSLCSDNTCCVNLHPVRTYYLKEKSKKQQSGKDNLTPSWRNEPASNRQQKALRFFGIDFTEGMTRGRASSHVARLLRDPENEEQWSKYQFLAHDFGHDSPTLQPFVREELEFFGLPLAWEKVDSTNGSELRRMVKDVVLPPEWMELRNAVFEEWHLGRGNAL